MTMSSWPGSLPAELAEQGSRPRSSDRQFSGIASYAWFEVWRRAYRWTRLTQGLSRRIDRLKREIGPLPRTIGVPLADLDPALDQRLAAHREQDRELVIGDFDQDGGIVSRFGPIAGVPTIDPPQFLTRSGYPVLLVDLNGRLGVRKQYRGPPGRFVLEMEAMVQLERRGCPVPQVMNVDWAKRWLTMTFVPGTVVREMLAQAGANIRDRDSPGNYSRAVDRERIRTGRAYVPKVLSREDVARIAESLKAIHASGFVLEDVKFGNIILSGTAQEPVFLDLERALPTNGLPSSLVRHLIGIDLKKFRDQFGDWESGHGAQ